MMIYPMLCRKRFFCEKKQVDRCIFSSCYLPDYPVDCFSKRMIYPMLCRKLVDRVGMMSWTGTKRLPKADKQVRGEKFIEGLIDSLLYADLCLKRVEWIYEG